MRRSSRVKVLRIARLQRKRLVWNICATVMYRVFIFCVWAEPWKISSGESWNYGFRHPTNQVRKSLPDQCTCHRSDPHHCTSVIGSTLPHFYSSAYSSQARAAPSVWLIGHPEAFETKPADTVIRCAADLHRNTHIPKIHVHLSVQQYTPLSGSMRWQPRTVSTTDRWLRQFAPNRARHQFARYH